MEENLAIQDEVKIVPIQRKTALITRMGGVGDCIVLTVIAKELHKRGYLVDYFCGSPTGNVSELFTGLPYINQCKEIKRVNRRVDCIEDDDKHLVSIELLKPKYTEVFDFMDSIENNVSGYNPRENWRATLNSNYQNWTDLSLGWANIDPTSVAPSEKRPEINYTPKEVPDDYYDKYYKWLFEETPIGDKELRDFKVIGVQLQASTLIRSWYRAGDLPDLIHKQYPNDIVVIFANTEWYVLSKNGKIKIEFPEDFNKLICSTVLIEQMDCFISADSGMSHIAEAVSTPTIGIYTTVPAWTREKYYKYSYPLEAKVECHPCFELELFCPLNVKKAQSIITPEEKEIVEAGKRGDNPGVLAKKFNTVPKAIIERFESIMRRTDALSAEQPACVSSITPEMILNRIEEVLCNTRS